MKVFLFLINLIFLIVGTVAFVKLCIIYPIVIFKTACAVFLIKFALNYIGFNVKIEIKNLLDK